MRARDWRQIPLLYFGLSLGLSLSLCLFPLSVSLPTSLSAFPSLIPEEKRDVSLAEGLWSSALGVGKQELRWWTQPPRFNTSCKFQEKGTPRTFPLSGAPTLVPRAHPRLLRRLVLLHNGDNPLYCFSNKSLSACHGKCTDRTVCRKKFRNSRRNASLVWTSRYCEEI